MNTSERLLPSLDLVHRVTQAATAYTMARMRILEQIPGNPVGVAIHAVDNVVALMARNLPSPSFNSVTGLRQGQADRIQPLVAWYREHGVAGRFEIAAGDHDPALGRELARLGFFQSGCHAALVGDPDLDVSVPGTAAIESVTSPEQMDGFLAAYARGWGRAIAFQNSASGRAR